MEESMAHQEKLRPALIMQNEREHLLEKMERTKKQWIAGEEEKKREKLDDMFIGLFCGFCKSLFKADGDALSQLNDQEFIQLDQMFLQYAEQLLEKRERSWRTRRIAALCVPVIGWFVFGLSAIVHSPEDRNYCVASAFGIYRKKRGQLVHKGEVDGVCLEDYPVLRKTVFENHKDDSAPLAFLSEHLRQKFGDKKAQLPVSQSGGAPQALPA